MQVHTLTAVIANEESRSAEEAVAGPPAPPPSMKPMEAPVVDALPLPPPLRILEARESATLRRAASWQIAGEGEGSKCYSSGAHQRSPCC